MRVDRASNCTGVTSRRVNSINNFDIGCSHGHTIAAGDPVLRAEVRISVHRRRRLGYRVIRVGDPVIGAFVLRGDVL